MAEEKVVVATEEKAVENKGPRAPRGDRPQRGPRKDGKKPFKKTAADLFSSANWLSIPMQLITMS